MKDNVKRMRKQVTDWEKIFAKDISDKERLSKTYNKLLNLNNKKTNNLIKKDWNRHLTKGDTQMANEHMKRQLTSYVIRDLQIKITMKYHYTTMRIAKTQNTANTKSC